MELRNPHGNLTLAGVLVVVPLGMLAVAVGFALLPYLGFVILLALPAALLYCFFGSIAGFIRQKRSPER